MKSFAGANGAFTEGCKREKGGSGAGLLENEPTLATGLLAPRRTGEAKSFVLQTAKSFDVLSVRDRSSGTSVATIPHSRSKASAGNRILPIRVFLFAILKSVAT